VTRVLIADDHPLMLSGIEAVLRDSAYEVVATARDGHAALDLLAEREIDLAILDVSMPGPSGIEILRTLRERGDARPVILLTASLDDAGLAEAVGIGVNGIVLKDGAETQLLACLDEVRGGGRWIERALLQRALDLATAPRAGNEDPFMRLAPREREIAGLVAQGLRNREVGKRLGMTEGTVKVYLHRIYDKLEIQNRVELAMLNRDRDHLG
jgi:two-component system nitrate/nitrite response regulator NarL